MPEPEFSLATPLRALPWLTPQRRGQLEAFGLVSLRDLLTHFPRRYEDRRQFADFPQEESDTPVCVCGVVIKSNVRRFGYRKWFEVTLQQADAGALSGQLNCRWFNAHYVQRMLAVGQRLVVYGKPKRRGAHMVLDHPDFEVIENDEENSIHFQRIVPVHPATGGITPRQLRSWIYQLLQTLPELPGPLPRELEKMDYREALRAIHFPESWEERDAARRELALAEFFEMQLFIGAKRAENLALRGAAHCGSGRLLENFLKKLPFALTGAQQRAIAEIRADLAAPLPMNRLLHGDVGSGKTLVALAAMLLTVEAGYQAALMAPTQILAEQHYLNFQRYLEPLGVRLALHTGSRKESTAPLPLFAGTSGDEPQILVGTHALLYEGVGFTNLGLAIIDEQHKFGVRQRAALVGSSETLPDVLVMTATPIPRTLTMTLFGDLDVSTLNEMPPNRGKILTAARTPEKLPDAIAFMKEHLAKGRQIYVVYPLIDASAKLEAKAAAEEFEKWQSVFAPYKCELLHGRVDAAEKDLIMQRFRKNESQVLVATTVIEVGIDVPNATIMLIENAERFGLAQLHQLRGRIGRGKHTSYCLLLHNADTPDALEKMRTMEATNNGFEIAEADLRLRGPGDILGTAQSGLPPLKIGDVIADTPLMLQAREVAITIFRNDPKLQAPENQPFKETLAETRKLTLAGVS